MALQTYTQKAIKRSTAGQGFEINEARKSIEIC